MTRKKSLTGYVDPTPGYDGNQAHGLYKFRSGLIEGLPFDEEMMQVYHDRLARWGYTREDLQEDGILGDMIDMTAKLGTVSELLWLSLLKAAILGQLDRFEQLEGRYGHRLNQALKWHKELLEAIGQAKSKNTLDYEEVLEAAMEASQNGP